MALIRNISIGFGAKTDAFIADIYKSTAALDAMARSSEAAQLQASKITGPGGGGGGSEGGGGGAPEKTGALAATVAGSLAPLIQIGATIQTMFDRVGGTIVTLARRIDESMKFEGMMEALIKLEALFKGVFEDAAGSATKASTAIAQGATQATDVTAQRYAKLGADMASLGQIALKVKGFFSTWGDVAAKNLSQIFNINTAFQTVGVTVQHVTTGVKGMGRQIALAFGFVGIAFTAARVVKNFFATGIKGAMDMAESIDKNNIVFGKFSDSITAHANSMARQLKVPKGAILDAAGSIGLLAKGAGQTDEAAARMAKTMTTIGANVASRDNLKLVDVMQKLRSGLTGEAEPMRSLGVLLSEGAMKAQAAAMGFKAVNGELSEQNKVMVRASLIEKGLVTATDNLKNTFGSAANQFRAAGGGMENFAVSIGTLLLPSVTLAITSFNELGSYIVETFENKQGVVTNWANNVKTAVETVVKSMRYFSDYWQIAQLSATQAMANIYAYLDILPTNLKIIGDYIAGNWVKLIADAFNYLKKVLQNAFMNLDHFEEAIKDFAMGKGFQFKWHGLAEGFKATMGELPALAHPIITDLSGEMGDIFAGIEAKEKARKAAMAPIGAAARPEIAGAAAAAGKEAKHEGVAAVTAGSTEAASALAKFFNKSSGETAAKETAGNTKQLVEIEKKNGENYAKLLTALASGNETSIAIAQL